MTISPFVEVYGSTSSSEVGPPPSGDVPTYSDATRYVTVSGAGSHDGTSPGNAWTLLEACANCQPGDIIGVEVGRYVGVQKSYDDTRRYRASFAPARSGTADSPIVFVARNPAALTTDIGLMSELCSGSPVGYHSPPPSSGSTEHYIWPSDRGSPAFGTDSFSLSYHQWIGFYCSTLRPDTGMKGDSGVATFWGASHMTIAYCRFEGDPVLGNNNYSAIRFEGCTDSNVRDNVFTDWGQYSQGSPMKYYGAERCVFEHNEVYRCQTGLNPKGWNFDLRIQDNDWRYNYFEGVTGAVVVAQAVVEGTGGERNRFHNNVIKDSRTLWFVGRHPGGGMNQELYWGGGADIYNNTQVGDSSSPENLSIIYHSTGWPDAIGGGDNTFYNNICVDEPALTGVSWTSDSTVSLAAGWADHNYNNYSGTPYAGATWSGGGELKDYTWASWQALPEDANSDFADPQFVNKPAGDYRLKAGSPCRGSGKDGVTKGAYISGDEVIGVRTG